MSPEASQYTENLIAAQGAHINPETSPLDVHLTAEQRAKVFAWIEDREEDLTSSVKRIFSEFGVKVSKIAVRAFYQKRKMAIARVNLREQAEAAKEVMMAGADADTVEDAVIATLINRAMEVVTQDKITPSLYREVVGLVVRLREQKISMERLRLERARFELDVAELVMKHIDKLKSSGVLQIEDRGEAAKKIRESIFGKYTKEQLEAAKLASA
jgi:hypothetical protein